jgi:hypothetical protein
MASIKSLMDELNAREFRCFAQKENPGKFTLSIKGDAEGERFFLTNSISENLNEDGSANYRWHRGAKMVKQPTAAETLEDIL